MVAVYPDLQLGKESRGVLTGQWRLRQEEPRLARVALCEGPHQKRVRPAVDGGSRPVSVRVTSPTERSMAALAGGDGIRARRRARHFDRAAVQARVMSSIRWPSGSA